MTRVSVSVSGGRVRPVAVEVHSGWSATARRTDNGAEVEVTRAARVWTFGAYLLGGRWRCHGIGRSDMPDVGKRIARAALAQLPTR